MKLQIDPLLRQHPFEYVEMFEGNELTEDEKKNFHLRHCHSLDTKHYLHFGYYIETNISDLSRLNEIIANHIIKKSQTSALANIEKRTYIN